MEKLMSKYHCQEGKKPKLKSTKDYSPDLVEKCQQTGNALSMPMSMLMERSKSKEKKTVNAKCERLYKTV